MLEGMHMRRDVCNVVVPESILVHKCSPDTNRTTFTQMTLLNMFSNHQTSEVDCPYIYAIPTNVRLRVQQSSELK